jgi:predicted aspartyl protease
VFLLRGRGLLVAVGATAGMLTAPAVAAAGALAGGTVPATYGSAAVVKVSVGGRKLLFIVDTGASTSAITARAAKTLGLVPAGAAQKVSTIGCSTSTRYAPIAGWRVGKVALPATQIGILHSSLSSKTAHSPTISGLLGSDVLSQFGRVTFDLAHQRLILGGRPVGAHSGIPMTVLRSHGAVEETVRATINGHAARYVLDTGSPLTLLQASAAKRFGLASAHLSIKVHGAAGCSLKAGLSEIIQWNAGGEPLPTTAAITTSGAGSGLSSKGSPAGLIGAGTLFDFGRLEMDFARGRLVFGSPAA